jgi:hypothetical protein
MISGLSRVEALLFSFNRRSEVEDPKPFSPDELLAFLMDLTSDSIDEIPTATGSKEESLQEVMNQVVLRV